MTVSADNSVVKVTTADGTEIVIPVAEVTALTDALLSARKQAYGNLRAERTAAAAAKKAAADTKKAERVAAKVKADAARLAALKAKVAELENSAPKSGKKSQKAA